MSKLLFVDRTASDGKRVFHFLHFSAAKKDFYIKSYLRKGEDVEELEASVPDFLANASTTDQKAFAEAVQAALSLELIPSLRIVEENK